MDTTLTTSTAEPAKHPNTDLLSAFMRGLTDIVDPAILFGDDVPAPVEMAPQTPASQDRDSIAGDWQRVGGYLAGAMLLPEPPQKRHPLS